MKLHLLVTLSVLGVSLLFGQAMAAGPDNGYSLIDKTIQSSTERGLTDTTMGSRTAETRDVRSYFGSGSGSDLHRTIESSKERGLRPAAFAERDRARDVRPYFGDAENRFDIQATIESSRENGGRY